MPRSPLADPFAHHSWANVALINACRSLTPEQLATSVPGTFGSIIDTLRHTVGGDASYLNLLTGGQVAPIEDESSLGLDALRAAAEDHGAAWATFADGEIDVDAVVVRHRDDGSASAAPLGIRLAQALHHGSDHRSQICTALTMLGLEPPEIDVWAFAADRGLLRETQAEGAPE